MTWLEDFDLEMTLLLSCADTATGCQHMCKVFRCKL